MKKYLLIQLKKITLGVMLSSLTTSLLISCGSKEPEMVEIPNTYILMSKTEVTQGLYESIIGNNPAMQKNKSYPVEQVKWVEAIEFCNKLSEKENLEKVYTILGDSVSWNENANGYRLPTYEEFLYASKGGQDYKYAGSDNFKEVAFFIDEVQEIKKFAETKVASKKPNAYGLYDMNGNVEEWCWDSDGRKDEYRVYTGGSWGTLAENFSMELKNSSYPNQGSYTVGFRLVRTDVEKKLKIEEEKRLEEERIKKEAEEKRLKEIEEQEKIKAAEKALEKSNPKQAVQNYLDMVKIPGKNISMSKFEVTQRVYEMVHGKIPANTKIEGDKIPVTNLNWYDAILFCNELTKYLMSEEECVYTVNVTRWWQGKEIMEAEVIINEKAKGFRLPTEKEWEYAAKGGKDFKYPGSDNLSEVAWWNKNSDKKLHEVGQLMPNGFGLYDMAGNACEWVYDNALRKNERIIRGGSCTSNEKPCSFLNDSWVRQGETVSGGEVGIRVVKND